MKSVKREELQGATINGLKNLLDDVNRKIVETKEFLNVLNENKKVYESELIEKQKIKTTNIIKIQKYKGCFSSTTDIISTFTFDGAKVQ